MQNDCVAILCCVMVICAVSDAFNSSVGRYTVYLVPSGSLPCADSDKNGVFYSHQRHAVVEYQKGKLGYQDHIESVIIHFWCFRYRTAY